MLQSLFRSKKAKCSQQTNGVILKQLQNGNAFFVTVEYKVDGKAYQLCEQVTYYAIKSQTTGSLHADTRWQLALPSMEPGAAVAVCYDPNRPKRSYLPENDGICIG